MKLRIPGALAVIVLVIAWSAAAQAQAARTWVSGVGDDANPCSRTAPCKTFAGAIAKTSAGGEIDALDPGDFGAVTITKSITIDGGGVLAGVLVSGTNAISVNDAGAETAVVTLRNLDIDGLGTGSPGLDGVQVLSAARVNIERCRIYGFSTSGVYVQSGVAYVNDSTIINNRNVSTADAVGILAVGDGVVVTAEGNHITGNDVGVAVSDGGTVRISDNAIYDNDTGVAGCGKGKKKGTIATMRNNRIESDFEGAVKSCKPNEKLKLQ